MDNIEKTNVNNNKCKISHSRTVCSVIGCPNTKGKNPDLEFYRFPGKNYEIDRRKKWIQALKISPVNGVPWTPHTESRICSAHFVGGKKSSIANSPAYIPTIFPYAQKRVALQGQYLGRFERFLKRNKREMNVELMESSVEPDGGKNNSRTNKIVETKSVGCQTDSYTRESTEVMNMFVCSREISCDGNNASTQTEIYLRLPQILKAIDVPMKQDKASGPNTETKPGFTGYADIASSDEKMKPLAGVSCDVFNMLLELIQPGADGQPKYYKKVTKENRLLLFLAKLKSGMSFCALGCLFSVHAVTVSTIFFDILNTLSVKTQSCIFWPSKEIVNQNLPKSFMSYPNCRCIIDCAEITTDTLSTAEQRLLLFSDNERALTVKVLIAITPNGYICKASKAYGGRTTDYFIANDCGLLDLIEPGDVIFAGKEFPEIQFELDERGATLVVPRYAFESQSTNGKVKTGHGITSIRNTIERVTQSVKSWGVLKHVDTELLPYIDDIIHVCCVITNLQQSSIKKDGSLKKNSEDNG